MPHIIQIPKPCNAAWDKMTPNKQGRHCDQCSKTVVDFTDWEPAAILFYLKMNSGSCGRFSKDQLDVVLPSPEYFVAEIVRLPFSFVKRIAAIFLFVFGLMAGVSCNNPTPPTTHTNAVKQDPNLVAPPDTTIRTRGIIVAPPPVVAPPKQPEFLLGEPAVIEPDVTLGAPVMLEVPDTTKHPNPESSN